MLLLSQVLIPSYVQVQPMSQPQLGMLLNNLAPDSKCVYYALYAIDCALKESKGHDMLHDGPWQSK